MIYPSWLNLNIRPIGLDIGHDSIKMLQLSVDKNRLSVFAASRAHIDESARAKPDEYQSWLISKVRQMLKEGSFRGRRVVSCLPNDKLKVTSIRLPEMELEETEKALQKEVAQRFGFDPDKDAINYLLAGSVLQGEDVKNEVILFAADDGVIREHIYMLEQMELEPVAIDTVPCAMFRSFERLLRRQEDLDQALVFIDIGYRTTTVVFGRGGKISFIKRIPIGGRRFSEEIADRLGLTIEEAKILRSRLRSQNRIKTHAISGHNQTTESSVSLDGIDMSTRQQIADTVCRVAEEISRELALCFRYYTVTFRGKRIERAILTGGEAYEDIFLKVLRQHLSVDVELAEPLKDLDLTEVDFDSDKRGCLCEWAIALGLSLKGWKHTPSKLNWGENHERN